MTVMGRSNPTETTPAGDIDAAQTRLCDNPELIPGERVSSEAFAAVALRHPELFQPGEASRLDTLECQACGACAIAGMKFRPDHAPSVPHQRPGEAA